MTPARRPLTLVVTLMIVAAAWLPSVRRYVPVSDDFPLAATMDGGVRSYLHAYLPIQGVWRVLQQPMVAGLTRPGGVLFPAVAFGLNLATAGLFFGCCRRLARSTAVAGGATVLSFAFPWGFQALVWASAFGNAVTTFALFATLYLLLAARRRWRPLLAVAAAGLTIAANLTQENLVFSYVFVGLLAVLPRRPTSARASAAAAARRLRSRPDAWATTGAAVLFLTVFVATRTAASQKQAGFHLPTVFSVFARQYANLWVFGVWRSRSCVAEAWHAGGALWVVAGALFVAAALLGTSLPRPPERRRRFDVSRLAAVVAVLFGSTVIYALSGGWSNDSRKKYDVVPPMVLAAAVAVAGPVGRVRPGPILVGLGLVAVPTTWAVTGTYAAEVARSHLLYDALAADRPAGPVAVRWSPDAYAGWPRFEPLLGFRLDAQPIIDQATDDRGQRRLTVLKSDDPVPQTATVYTVGADAVDRTPPRRPK